MANKSPSSQSYGFFSSHVRMWELDHKESWTLKNGCFWAAVLEKTLESPLDCKEIKPGNPKGNKSWIFVGMTDAEAETLILWPPDVKNWLTGKYPDAGKDWRLEEGLTGWGGWIASLTQWTWVWASSGSWWRTGKPGVPQSIGSQRVRRDWATELNWCLKIKKELMKEMGGIILVILILCVFEYHEKNLLKCSFLTWKNPNLKDSDKSGMGCRILHFYMYCTLITAPPQTWVDYNDCKDHLEEHIMKHRTEIFTSQSCRRSNRDAEALDTSSSIIQWICLVVYILIWPTPAHCSVSVST